MADDFELDDELKQYIEERLGEPFEDSTSGEPDPEPTDDGEPSDGDDGEDEGQEVEGGDDESEPSSPPSNIFEIAPGVAISREQALSFYQFDALLKGRPDLVGKINDLVNGRTTGETVVSEPAPASLDIPEEYRDDPALKPVYESYAAQRAAMAEMQQRIDELQSRTVDREREEFTVLVDTQKARFQQEHGLSADEMQKVIATATNLEVLPKLMTGIDPITGQPGPRDRSQALNRAFEIAYWYLPEMREKALAKQVTARAKSTQRKQRLAGVSGGGGGSVPQNTDPRKMNALERREAMIREVAGLGGQEE